MNVSHLAVLMRMLGERATVRAIHDATGVSKDTIRKTLRALEVERVARIVDWKRDTGGAAEPVWTLGSEPSVPLRGMTDAQKQALYRQRQRAGRDVMASMAMTIVSRNCNAEPDEPKQNKRTGSA